MSVARTVSPVRRFFAITTAAVALLSLAAQPALAAAGYASAQRNYTLSGDRHRLRVDARVTDPAPNSGLNVSARWGTGEGSSTLALGLTQGTGGADSRALKLDGYGGFKAVDGTGCTHAPIGPGYGRLTCNRAGYDWLEDRTYRMVIARGDLTDKGRLWTISLVDRVTSARIKVVSFRTAAGRLADSEVNLYSNIANCDNVNAVQAVVSKPVGDDGTTVAWGAAETFSECTGPKLSAPLNSGKVTLNIK